MTELLSNHLMLVRRVPLVVEAAILADYDPEVVSGGLHIAVLHGSTVLKEVFRWICNSPCTLVVRIL